MDSLDIFSRYVVAWCVARDESCELAYQLIAGAAGTVAMAAIVLGERINRTQSLGLAFAAIAVVLVTAG